MESEAAQAKTAVTNKPIATRIPILDELLGGGLGSCSISAFWSERGVESSALALQVVMNRIKEGDKVVIASASRKETELLQEIRDLGFDANAFQSNSNFVDCTHSEALADNRERTLSDIKLLLSSNAVGGARTFFLVDSVNEFAKRSRNFDEALRFFTDLRQVISSFETTSIFVIVNGAEIRTFLEGLIPIFYTIVELAGTSQAPVYAMRIRKPASGVLVSDRFTFFKVSRPGGVKIYLPKIVITGPFHAGKTSFIHSASIGAVSADRLGTTVALDYAHLDYAGYTIDLFGTPGQSRFDPLVDKLGGNALGLILLVSATDSRGLVRAKEQFRLINAEKLPYVLAVNKVNLRGAISLHAVRHLLGISSKIPVLPLRAKNLAEVKPGEPCELDSEDVRNVLDKIISLIAKSQQST